MNKLIFTILLFVSSVYAKNEYTVVCEKDICEIKKFISIDKLEKGKEYFYLEKPWFIDKDNLDKYKFIKGIKFINDNKLSTKKRVFYNIEKQQNVSKNKLEFALQVELDFYIKDEKELNALKKILYKKLNKPSKLNSIKDYYTNYNSEYRFNKQLKYYYLFRFLTKPIGNNKFKLFYINDKQTTKESATSKISKVKQRIQKNNLFNLKFEFYENRINSKFENIDITNIIGNSIPQNIRIDIKDKNRAYLTNKDIKDSRYKINFNNSEVNTKKNEIIQKYILKDKEDRVIIIYYPLLFDASSYRDIFKKEEDKITSILDKQFLKFLSELNDKNIYSQIYVRVNNKLINFSEDRKELKENLFLNKKYYDEEYKNYYISSSNIDDDFENYLKNVSSKIDIIYFSNFQSFINIENIFQKFTDKDIKIYLINFVKYKNMKKNFKNKNLNNIEIELFSRDDIVNNSNGFEKIINRDKVFKFFKIK